MQDCTNKKNRWIGDTNLLQGMVIVAELGEAVVPCRRGAPAAILVVLLLLPPRRALLGAEPAHGRLIDRLPFLAL
jgi:hypothetical protein